MYWDKESLILFIQNHFTDNAVFEVTKVVESASESIPLIHQRTGIAHFIRNESYITKGSLIIDYTER